MKLRRPAESTRNNGSKRPRSAEVLMPESSEQIDFNPDRDLTAEQKAALFSDLDNREQMRDWPGYAELYQWLKALWPEMDGRVLRVMPVAELRTKITEAAGANRLDLAAKYAANIRALGISLDSFFDPSYVSAFLKEFDQNFSHPNLDAVLSQNAMTIVRLGLRSRESVFSDRAEAWQRCQKLLSIYHAVGLDYFARILLDLKILFSEHASELELNPEDLNQMKKELLTIEPSAYAKVGQFAFSLKALTAERVTLGSDGEYRFETRRPLGHAQPLPERDLT